MTHQEIRKHILLAIYNDDWLYNQLVLKGGNALSLVYNISARTTLDLDFSISSDFDNVEYAADKIHKALTEAFSKYNIIVFDFNFLSKPKIATEYWWGGYKAEFKLINKTRADILENDIDKIRRQSISVAPGSQNRKFTIEISKHEYISESNIEEYEGTNILVYSPVLLAAEKLRALLQQHPDYKKISQEVKRSRSRDLYDIWTICDYFSIFLPAHLETIEAVFKAKKVNMELLNDLSKTKDLHFNSWSSVENSVNNDIESYDFYFIYVDNIAKELYSRWKVNSP